MSTHERREAVGGSSLPDSGAEGVELPDHVRPLAERFHDYVFNSGRFTWMGGGTYVDELQRLRMEIHLLEDESAWRDASPDQVRPVSVNRTFDPLAEALYPQLRLNLYYLSAARLTPEEAREHVSSRLAAKREGSLTFERQIPPAPQK